ncbi:ribonuclease T2 [Polypterus senegalus]
MTSVKPLVFLCLCLIPAFHSFLNYKKSHEWTKLILTHHWPHTFCTMEKTSCQTADQFNYWTLHGFWPNKGGMCNHSWHFNVTNIEGLLPDMQRYWPDLLHPNSTLLWKHEWVKHGTCAAYLESINTQYKYFAKSLEMYKEINLDNTLLKFNIVPSEKTYSLKEIREAILNYYQVAPKIQCVLPSQGEQVQLLGQIEICVDKQFQYTNCSEPAEDLPDSDIDIPAFELTAAAELHVCDESIAVLYPPVSTKLWRLS